VRGTGPDVTAVRLADVRAEFVKRYPTGETDNKTRLAAIRSAFRNGKKYAMQRGFAFDADTEGTEWVWQATKSVTSVTERDVSRLSRFP
jgi:hypothetical protein